MNYNIKGTGVSVTDELRDYIEKRLAHAGTFVGGDTTAHTDVELEYSARHDPSSAEATEGKAGKYRAEFTAGVGGQVYRAAQWGSTLHEAINIASAELAKELRREKKQKLKIFRHSAVRVKEYLRGWRKKV
ncbi:MAG: ribosome-associated translation inhibitor RaiA [Patescibacteria group bacterium]|nr:ribosome-associated translation inhibitor RaiA [Patescibacteria group bacterium]